jgi:hypothetical protein
VEAIVAFHSAPPARPGSGRHIVVLSVVLCCAALPRSLAAQQPSPAGLQRQLDSLAALVGQLQQQVALTAEQAASPPAVQARAGGAFMNVSFVGLTDLGWSTEPDVGSLQLGDHDPKVRGFTLPNEEFVLDGAIDPYFRGFASVVYKLDPGGETGIELEEAYFLTTSLPRNLQLKGGQFFIEFGRHSPQHPHAWAFADQPLVLNRMFGADGLRSQGLRLSWLLPTSFYTEALLGVFNSTGETTSSFRSEESPEIHGGAAAEDPVRGAADLLWVPRVATSLDLTDEQTVLFGASAALGPNNSGANADTRIWGADVYWKWKSLRARQGFPFVSLQAEALWRDYDAASRVSEEDAGVIFPSETLRDSGFYAQALWGIRPLVVAGLRGELVTGEEAAFDSPVRTDRYRISPNFTWYPSEYSKVRIQYNYDHRQGIGRDHSLWAQIEFLLGAHAAHQF